MRGLVVRDSEKEGRNVKVLSKMTLSHIGQLSAFVLLTSQYWGLSAELLIVNGLPCEPVQWPH